MAPRTVHRRVQMLLGDDLFPDRAGIAVRNPIQLRHQLHGPYVRRGIAVAVQTEGHIERFLLMYLDHLVDAAVATDATHTHGDVRLLITAEGVARPVNMHTRK